MKKFNFSLQKVLEYDTHLQNKETDRLGLLRNEYHELEIKRMALHKRHELTVKTYQKYCESGIPVQKAAALRLFIEEQKEQLSSLDSDMAEKRKLIDNQVEKLLEITKDKMTVEKLKEGSVAAYNDMARKNEEVLIDEFVANSAAKADIRL